jgi:hypothetical protein
LTTTHQYTFAILVIATGLCAIFHGNITALIDEVSLDHQASFNFQTCTIIVFFLFINLFSDVISFNSNKSLLLLISFHTTTVLIDTSGSSGVLTLIS